MSDIDEKKDIESSFDEDDIEFVEYSIDEETKVEYEDVEKLTSEAKKKQAKEEFNLKKEIFSWISMIVISLGIAFVISKLVLINAVVPTGSMLDTIPLESRMIGFRLAYLFSEPERGDIIIFKSPLDESEDYVKRVIGLPGERIVIEDNHIYVYDSKGNIKENPLNEPYIREKSWTAEGETYEFIVPEDRYLVLGDNRNNSKDARSWYKLANGENLDEVYIHKDKILAKALFIYWDTFKWFGNVEY